MQKIISNGREANLISNEHRKEAATIIPVRPALSVPVAASIDLVLEAGPAIWTARHRIDRVAIFRASGSRVSNAAAVVEILVVIVLAVEASVVTVLAVEDSAAVAIALVVAASAAGAALAVSAAAAGDDGNN